ncbi:MAG: matrixin family metalloprotease [Candidatus Obscuribacterales bacterium]
MATREATRASRLSKACLVISLAFALFGSSFLGAFSQNRLPRAGFFNNSTYGRPNQPSVSAGGVSDYHLQTPGLHLTRGENRTRQNLSDPYNPGEETLNMAFVRWDTSRMPLKIWISPGLELPKMPFDQLQQTRVVDVFKRLRREDPFGDLGQAQGWTEETNYQVAAGIEQWRIFQDEGLISFGFVNDPRDADIFVFYTDMFQGTSGPGGINVGGNTSARAFSRQDLANPLYRKTPVIIELSTRVNHLPEKMQGAAAHEFGHALGIKAHSPYRDDIMYSDRVVTSLSEGDKATLRLLYHTKWAYAL